MGLCKCPKRKVTNQFCFEHRVNVCEHCMVASHAKCVVQSYLAWLQDSDYSPDCQFCQGPLNTEQDCVRLVCYHLFHWVCLERHFRALPASTAPAGYTCPCCSSPVFPSDNLVSPVADKLRSILQDVNWARAGLGLPLLEDKEERQPGHVPTGPRPNPEGEDVPRPGLHLAQELLAGGGGGGAMQGPDKSVQDWKQETTVVNLDTSTSRRGGTESLGLFSSALASSPLITGDPDSREEKYKRRAPTDWFLRWWRTMMKPAAQRRRGAAGWLMVGLLLLLGLLSLVAVFSYLSRGGVDDPLLDPMNNPNIRVGDGI